MRAGDRDRQPQRNLSLSTRPLPTHFTRPTLEQLAGFLNISPRMLARYLDAENTSFRDLSPQVRTARARQLLAEGDLLVTQIAYRLGYADVASFVRSFRAQTGRTPGAVKRSRSRLAAR